MLRFSIRITITAVFLSQLAIATHASPALYRNVDWLRKSDTNTVGTGIWLFERTETADRVVLLLKTVRGSRYALTYTAEALSGQMRSRITDDRTGWSAELVFAFGFAAHSMPAWSSLFEPENMPDDHDITVSASVNGSRLGPVAAKYDPALTGYQVLVREARLNQTHVALPKDIPAELLVDLPMLMEAFTLENEYGFHMRGVVAMLAGLAATKREAEAIAAHAGPPLTDPTTDGRIKEFLAEFKHRDEALRLLERSQ